MNSNIRYLCYLALLGFWVLVVSANGTEIYVSPLGNDAHSGTLTEPFRTLERAKAEVRTVVIEGLREPVTVFLRSGNYELSKNLIFNTSDSGTEVFAITYKAFQDETVSVSGGRRISNWKEDDQGVWTAELPDVKNGKWFFRQLIVNDRRAVRARWPNQDGELRIRNVADGVQRFGFNKTLPWKNLNEQDTEMVVYENWSVTRGLVSSSDNKQLTTKTSMEWIGHGNFTTASKGKPVYLEHARSFLDAPGEWFLDRKEGVLYYQPIKGEDPSNSVIVAPVLQRLLVIAGRRGNPVKNLHFEGIHFEHVDFTFPSTGFNEIQAAHFGTSFGEPTYVHPVAVECVYAEGCRFESCSFAYLNCSGIGFGPGCKNNTVLACLIDEIGGNGVMVGWRGVGRLDPGMQVTLDADWNDSTDVPVGTVVSNCHIRRCGTDAIGGVGIFVAFSADTKITHNVIHDLPYSGVSIGYRWTTEPTSQVRCLVENNHVFDVMKKFADGAGIYTLGFQSGTVLRGNHIHDVQRSVYAHGGAPNNGFFIDAGSKGFLFDSNVVYDSSGASVRFNKNQADWHDWKNNYFGDVDAKSSGARAIIKKAGIGPEYLNRVKAMLKEHPGPGSDMPKKRRFLRFSGPRSK